VSAADAEATPTTGQEPKTSPAPLAWIDMEMSGLDPATCHILEIAVLLTDADLQPVGEALAIVVHQPEPVLAAMDAWNTAHHGKSGLTAAVRASTVSVADAQEAILALLRAHTQAGASPLAGNSAYVDRMFLRAHMPLVDQYLHYRIVDVSAVKELAARWYPDLRRFQKREQHRALDDIQESIAELRYYRERLFRPALAE
jgi:oligoribonuclease